MAIHQQDSFSFVATGDAIITRRLLPYEGMADEFDDLLALLRGAEATLTNFETLVESKEGYPSSECGGTYLRSPSYVLNELSGMGCNLFSAATNHAFDYGHTGIEQTIDAFKKRELAMAGLGMNRYEARRPCYVETQSGRVGLVSTCTSITPGSRAGEQSSATNGRPGINPLDIETIYCLPESRLEELRKLSDAVGFEDQKQSWLERGLYFNHDWNQDEYFHFGDMKFKTVDVEGGISYETDEQDKQEVLEWIEEASANANWVIASVHSHQGVDGRQNTTETPEFLREFAREAVDRGADVVVGTGPHVLRGIEIYDGAPIFYSLGNFIIQDESVDRLPPENFRRYGIEDYTKPSRAFDARNHNEDGELMSDRANPECWVTVVPECRFTENESEITLHPVTLQREEERPQHGTPVLATGSNARNILENIATRSEPFGTNVELMDETATISIK